MSLDFQTWIDSLDPTMLMSWATNVVGVLVLLLVAWMVAGWVRRSTRRGLEQAGVDPTLTRFFANFVRYAVLTVAVIACLGIFGVETTSFAAVLAAAGFAIGLAFQNTLSNFSAGVMLLVFRPFGVGDVQSVVGGGRPEIGERAALARADRPESIEVVPGHGQHVALLGFVAPDLQW